jgi:hypothetical protein
MNMELFVVIEWYNQYEAGGILGVFDSREEAERVAMDALCLCSVVQRALGQVYENAADFTEFVEVGDPTPTGPFCPL